MSKSFKTIITEAIQSYDGGDEAAHAYRKASGFNLDGSVGGRGAIAGTNNSHDDSYFSSHNGNHVYVGFGSRGGDSHDVHVNGKHIKIPAFSNATEEDMENGHYQLADDHIGRAVHGMSDLSTSEKESVHHTTMSALKSMYG